MVVNWSTRSFVSDVATLAKSLRRALMPSSHSESWVRFKATRLIQSGRLVFKLSAGGVIKETDSNTLVSLPANNEKLSSLGPFFRSELTLDRSVLLPSCLARAGAGSTVA